MEAKEEEQNYRTILYKEIGLTELQADILVAERKKFALIKCEETINNINHEIEKNKSGMYVDYGKIPQDLLNLTPQHYGK